MHGTGKSAKRKKKPPPPLEDAEQFQRFVETAKKLGVDESGDSFERAFKKIVPVKRKA
jgi:hypothetical protein